MNRPRINGPTLSAVLIAGVIAATTSAATAAASFPADVRTFAVTGTGVSGGGATQTHNANKAPFNLMEPFEIGNRAFVLMLSSETGFVRIVELNSSGGTDARGSILLGNEGWRSAQVWREGGQTRVHFYAPRTGATLRYEISDGGFFDASSRVENAFDELKDKTIVSGYTRGSQRRAFAIDTFNGDVAIHTLGPQSIANTASYSKGWSDVDHVRAGGSTYRVLYKEVGLPYRRASESSESGRLVMVRVGSDGMGEQTLIDTDIGAGWSQVGFTVSAGNAAIYAYNRRTGGLLLLRFFSSTPGSIYQSYSSWMVFNLDALVSVTRGSDTFLVGAQFDPAVAPSVVLDGEPAGRLAECVDKKLSHLTAGYQFAVIQNGKYLINRARGFKELGSNATPLERNDRIDHGSVGKMFTAVTALKSADNGVLNLDASIASQMNQGTSSFRPWTFARTTRDLIAQTSGWDRDGDETYVCERVGQTLTTDCSPMLSNSPFEFCQNPNDVSNRSFDCKYAYYNGNFGMVRKLLERQHGVSTTPELDQLTRDLWLDDVLPNGPSCRQQASVKRFRLCEAGEPCVINGGIRYNQVEPGDYKNFNRWSGSCGAGGWRASARDVAQLVEQLRAEQVLSGPNTDGLFATDWLDGSGTVTGLGWEAPYTARSFGQMVLGKDGGTGRESAFVTSFEGHVSASLVHNSGGSIPSAASALKQAYRYALGQDSTCEVTGVANRLMTGSGGATSEVFAEYLPDRGAYVVALRNAAGKLVIKAYDLSSDGTVVQRVQHIGGAATQLSLARVSGGQFMVGFKNNYGRFEIQLFSLSSSHTTLTKQDEYKAGSVRSVKLVHVATSGAEVAAVLKNGSSKMQIIMFDRSGSSLHRVDDYTTTGAISGVDATSEPGRRRIATGIRTTDGRTRIIIFDSNYSGTTLTRRGRSPNAQEIAGSQVRIGFVDTPEGGRYVTSSIRSGALYVTAWSVSSSGNTVSTEGAAWGNDVKSLGRSMGSTDEGVIMVSAVSMNDEVAMIPFVLNNGGSTLTRQSTFKSKKKDDEPQVVTSVHAAMKSSGSSGSLMTVFIDDGIYRFSNWRFYPID